jgi:hypothetical protein
VHDLKLLPARSFGNQGSYLIPALQPTAIVISCEHRRIRNAPTRGVQLLRCSQSVCRFASVSDFHTAAMPLDQRKGLSPSSQVLNNLRALHHCASRRSLSKKDSRTRRKTGGFGTSDGIAAVLVQGDALGVSLSMRGPPPIISLDPWARPQSVFRSRCTGVLSLFRSELILRSLKWHAM